MAPLLDVRVAGTDPAFFAESQPSSALRIVRSLRRSKVLPEAPGLAELTADERIALLRWMGDTAFSALTAGQLKFGLCRSYAVGSPAAPAMAVVRGFGEPREPMAMGTDVQALWSLLARLPGWDCVNVEAGIGREVASVLEPRLELPSRIVSERIYSLGGEPRNFTRPEVRRLGAADLREVEGSDVLFRSFFVGHGSAARTLSDGVAAGSVSGGKLVSAITTSAWAGLHVDLGAATLPEARRRGLASAAAFLVCSDLRAAGLTPVWVAGEPNIASWRIPEKLGFRLVGRREYVVFDGLRPDGFRPR